MSASRGSFASRAVLKKLQGLIDRVFGGEEFLSMVEEIDEEERPEYLSSCCPPYDLQQYTTDLPSFSADVELALKHLSRLKGKRKFVSDVTAQFREALEETFPEMNEAAAAASSVSTSAPPTPAAAAARTPSSSRRRNSKGGGGGGGDESEEEVVEGTPLSPAHKAAFKTILSKLSKQEFAEIFMHPVDAKLYPEYYQIIQRPMDISTLKASISSSSSPYRSVEAALLDLRLIWENCRTFNAEGSDIVACVDHLAVVAEELIAEHLGPEFAEQNKKKKSKKAAEKVMETPAASVKHEKSEKSEKSEKKEKKEEKERAKEKEKERERKEEKEDNAVKAMDTEDNLTLPPEALSTLKKRGRKTLSEKAALEFANDIQSYTETLKSCKSKFTLMEGSANRKKLKKIVNKIQASDLAGPFLTPVDLDEAPGYLDYVSEPMDLSTVEANVKDGRYDNSYLAFAFDLFKISQNCFLYNDPASDISALAADLAAFAFDQVLDALDIQPEELEKLQDEAMEAAQTPAAPTPQPKPRAVAASLFEKETPKVENIKPEATPAKESRDHDDIEADRIRKAMKAKGKTVASLLGLPKLNKGSLNTFGKLIWDFISDMMELEQCKYFKVPVQVSELPGYLNVVARPSDFATLRSRLDYFQSKPYEFFAEVDLIFNNAKSYFPDGSDIRKAAEEMHDVAKYRLSVIFPRDDKGLLRVPFETLVSKVYYKRKEEWHDDYKPPSTEQKPPKQQQQQQLHQPQQSQQPPVLEVSNTQLAIPQSAAPTPVHAATQVIKALPEPVTPVAPAKPAPKRPNFFGVPEVRMPEEVNHSLSIINSVNAIRVPNLREAYIVKRKEVQEKLKTTQGILEVVPGVYDLVCPPGQIHLISGFCTESSIYPVYYKCRRTVQMEVHSDEFPSGKMSMPLNFVSCILPSSGGYHIPTPRFIISLENGSIITEATDPLWAWKSILLPEKRYKLINLLGSKMRRCRSVFNRICATKEAEFFKEMVPLRTGTAFYDEVKCPMWLREIHSKLENGLYENEFEFAFDMRLVFKGGMVGFAARPEVAVAAGVLSRKFDVLFCNWVLNVQDFSIEDIAKGPWDKWTRIVCFDGYSDEMGNSICDLCENRFEATQETELICPRCTEASQENLMTFDSIQVSLGNARTSAPNTKEEFGTPVSVPTAEFGDIGLCRYLKLRKCAFRDKYVTQFGFEVRKEGLKKQLAMESELEAKLKLEREMEFKAKYVNQTTYDSPRKRVIRPKKLAGNIAQADDNMQTDVGNEVTSDEILYQESDSYFDYGLLGKCNSENSTVVFKINSEEQAFVNDVVLNRSLEDAIECTGLPLVVPNTGSLVELTENMLPKLGYFGLEIIDIRVRIEVLESSEMCVGYKHLLLESCKGAVVEELLSERERSENLYKYEKKAREAIENERWVWERNRMRPPVPPTIPQDDHKGGFTPLFPTNITPFQGESMICVWDFLDALTTLHGEAPGGFDNVYSLIELFQAIPSENGTGDISYGQVIYDELGVIFAGFLFSELRSTLTAKLDNSQWWQINSGYPLNSLTWPFIAYMSIIASDRQGFSVEDILNLLKQEEIAKHNISFEIFALFCFHPAYRVLLDMASAAFMENKFASFFKDLQTIRAKLVAGELENAQAFANSMIDILKEHRLSNDSSIELKTSCHIFIQWFKSIAGTYNFEMADDDMQFEFDESLIHAAHVRNPMNEYILLPRHFCVWSEQSEYAFDLKVLEQLHQTLALLRSQEVSVWSADQKTTVLVSLLEFSALSKAYFIQSKEKQMKLVMALKNIDTIPSEPNGWPNFDGFDFSQNESMDTEDSKEAESKKCYISDVTTEQLNEWNSPVKSWVSVPALIMQPPSMDSYSNSSPAVLNELPESANENKVWALESIVKRICAAKLIAKQEKLKYESRVKEFNTFLSMPVMNLFADMGWKTARTLNLRSAPMGYDRFGRQYWLLNVQESQTLQPFGLYGLRELVDDADIKLDPAVLVREKDGWWGYHHGKDLPSLISDLDYSIPCEKLLGENMTIRLTYARGKLVNSTFRPRPSYSEWHSKREHLERHAKELANNPLPSSPVEACKQLELVYARLCEARMQVHYSSLFRADYDNEGNKLSKGDRERKIKRLRDSHQDDTLDFCPAKGWLRIDGLGLVRALSLATTASRLHADINYIHVLRDVTRRSMFKQHWIILTSKLVDDYMSYQTNTNDGGDEDGGDGEGDNMDQSDSQRPSLASFEEGSIITRRIPSLGTGPVHTSLPTILTNPVTSVPYRPLTNIIVSTVVVSAKLLSLKSQILSVFLCLPEKLLKWPDWVLPETPNNSEAPKEQSAEAGEANSQGATEMETADGEANEEAVLAKLAAEKAERKKKRREKRRLSNEKVLKDIQEATTAKQLLDVLLFIESAIPFSWCLDYPKQHLPCCKTGEVLMSDVAVHLFALDRLLRYEDIPQLETIPTKISVRPRINFVPRCYLSPSCRGYMCHPSKCTPSDDMGSRFTAILDPQQMAPAFTTVGPPQRPPKASAGPTFTPFRINASMTQLYNNNSNMQFPGYNFSYFQGSSSSGRATTYSDRNPRGAGRKTGFRFGKNRDEDEEEEDEDEEDEDELEDNPNKRAKIDVNIEFMMPLPPLIHLMTEFDEV